MPEDWRQANAIPIIKKGKKKNTGNYQLDSEDTKISLASISKMKTLYC